MADLKFISHIVVNGTCIRFLFRSIQKDFQRARFSEETILWWNEFFLHPVDTQYEDWPVFKKTKPVMSRSTLCPKELEAIESYRKKRDEFHKVSLNQLHFNTFFYINIFNLSPIDSLWC